MFGVVVLGQIVFVQCDDIIMQLPVSLQKKTSKHSLEFQILFRIWKTATEIPWICVHCYFYSFHLYSTYHIGCLDFFLQRKRVATKPRYTPWETAGCSPAVTLSHLENWSTFRTKRRMKKKKKEGSQKEQSFRREMGPHLASWATEETIS